MMLVSTISYVDRNTLALLAPTILKETGLSVEQYGWIIAAFSYAYMLGNPLWGRAMDRLGPRRGMLAAVSLWTVASAAHAFAGGFRSFAVFRTILGFGEGATFPGSLRTVMQTLDPTRRSRGIALSYSGGSLGALLTPLIVTPVAAWYGWRGAFWFTGAIGFAWIVWWSILSRRDDLRTPAAPVERVKEGAPHWRQRQFWAFFFSYAFGGIPIAFVLYNGSLYLGQGLGLSQLEIGAVLWIPPLGWEIGYFVWGWIVDRLSARGDSMAALRLVFTVLAIGMLPLALAPRFHSVPFALAMMFVAMFMTGGFIIASVAYATRVYSTAHAGYIGGLGAGSWSALIAIISPIFGRMFDRKMYDESFLLAAILPVVGYVLWLVLYAGPLKSEKA
jgi:ACS family hexuronate transporter-like MFS transporter